MKKASLVIEEMKENKYCDVFKDVYVDEDLLGYQTKRYIQAIEKFISLYGDQEIEIYSTPGRSEVCGNHTDHQHGEVLAAAINLDIIAIVALADKQIKVLSDDYDIEAVMIDDLDKKDKEVETSEGLIN